MKKKPHLSFGFNTALLLILIAAFVVIANLNAAFMSAEYVTQVVLKNVVEIGMLALPMTLIIAGRGIGVPFK